jgi:hypothetical protein
MAFGVAAGAVEDITVGSILYVFCVEYGSHVNCCVSAWVILSFLQFCHSLLPITLQNSLLLPVFFAYRTGSKKWKNFPIRPLRLPGVLSYDLCIRH